MRILPCPTFSAFWKPRFMSMRSSAPVRSTNRCSGSTASTAMGGCALMTSAAAACCCYSCAAARLRPHICPAAQCRRTMVMARFIWLFPSPPTRLRNGKRGFPRRAWRSRAGSNGHAAAKAFISAIPTATCSNWRRRDYGRGTNGIYVRSSLAQRGRDAPQILDRQNLKLVSNTHVLQHTTIPLLRPGNGGKLRPPVDRNDPAAGDAVFRRGEKHDRGRDFGDFRPEIVVGLRHGGAVGGCVHDRGRDRIDQNAVLGDFLGQGCGQRCDGGFARRIGDHAGAASPFERRAARRH